MLKSRVLKLKKIIIYFSAPFGLSFTQVNQDTPRGTLKPVSEPVHCNVSGKFHSKFINI
jgi:hypothetical protein